MELSSILHDHNLIYAVFSSIPGAQDIVIDDTPDPPDTEYARGVRLMSLQTVNKLARKPVFRAYYGQDRLIK